MKLYITEAYGTFFAKYLSLPFLFLSLLIVTTGEYLVAQSIPECQLPQFGMITVDPDIKVNG